MTPNEDTQFRNAGPGVPPGTVLKLLTTADDRGVELARFCERLAALIPNVSIASEEGHGLEHPLMLLPNGIRYQGIPQGNEVQPFIEALTGKSAPLAASLRERLKAVAVPAALELFVTPHCTHCPVVVRRLLPLAAANRLVSLDIIDGSMYPVLAERNRVQSVPTLLIDGRFRWTGTIELEEVVNLIVTRDPSTLGVASLETMLKEGSARRLAEMMAERGTVFPALVELLCHDQWPVRLGAMVAVEELHAIKPELAQQLTEPLWQKFDGASDQVKGDILHVFGEIGGRTVVAKLTSALTGAVSADVKEAAEEALEKMKDR